MLSRSIIVRCPGVVLSGFTTLFMLAIACTACRNSVQEPQKPADQAIQSEVAVAPAEADRKSVAAEPLPGRGDAAPSLSSAASAEMRSTDPGAKVVLDRGEPPANGGRKTAFLPPPAQTPIPTRSPDMALGADLKPAAPAAPVQTAGNEAAQTGGPKGTRASDTDPVIQMALAQVALRDKDWSVRMTAVERLTTQSVLAQVARSDKDSDIRKLAVSLMRDQSALSQVAQRDKDWSVRLSAVNQLVDKGVLARVALKDKDSDIRKRAVTRLTELAARPEARKSGTDVIPSAKEGEDVNQ